MKKIGLIVFVFITACAKNKTAYQNDTSVAKEVSAQTKMISDENKPKVLQNDSSTKNLLVKEARIEIHTDSIDEKHRQLLQMLSRHKGFVSLDNSEHYTYRKSYRLDIKVPVNDFENFVSEIQKKFDSIEFFEVRTQDVTDSFFDLKARLKNKKILKDRYLSLYQKAKNIEEIMTVENHISRIQTEIDRLEGKLQLLQEQTTYSTVSIKLYQDINEPLPPETNRYMEALKNGWSLFTGLMYLLLNLWTFILMSFVLFYLLKKKTRKKSS